MHDVHKVDNKWAKFQLEYCVYPLPHMYLYNV
jgi:hypothetical protein